MGDWSAACPESWEAVDDICVAPASYAGDCDGSMNTAAMTESEKHEFASNCGVHFPCLGSAAATVAASLPTLPNGPIVSKSVSAESHKTSGLPDEWFALQNGPVDSQGGIHF